VRASEDGIANDRKDEILHLMKRNRVSGMHIQLNETDLEEIVEMIL
jgi:hypothetical protein